MAIEVAGIIKKIHPNSLNPDAQPIPKPKKKSKNTSKFFLMASENNMIENKNKIVVIAIFVKWDFFCILLRLIIIFWLFLIFQQLCPRHAV